MLLIKLVDVTKLEGVADTPEGCAAPQRDPSRVERWAENCLRFNKGKSRVLQLGKNSPMDQHRLEDDMLVNKSVEKDVGVLVDNKLSMRQQCVLLAKKPMASWDALGAALPAD